MRKELFIKYLNGNCTDSELEQLLDWLKEESLTTSGKKMVQEVWDEFEPSGSVEKAKFDRLLDKIHHKINTSHTSVQPSIDKSARLSRMMSVVTRVAAILLLPVLSLFIYTQITGRDRYTLNSNELEVEAPAGFRMNIEFGDGTKVWLNHGSKLRYPYRFDSKFRKVELTGEAYFRVAHNSNVPFIVSTKNLDIKATGTEFNVSAYPGDDIVETTLVEGRVSIIERDNNSQIRTLVPGECILFNSEKNNYTMQTGDIKKYIAWKDGLLIFKNDSIREIAKKLERWYNVDVKIEDEKVNEFSCTATFSEETLSQVLELMSLPSPVSYKLTPKVRYPDGSFSKQSVIIGLKQ